MVKNLQLRSLLDIDDLQTRNQALRRAFAAFSELIDVTGDESSALTILVNLTFPKAKVDDLLDAKLAKKTLGDQSHIDACISEVQWFHTHNLKYPDIRVSKQNLIVSSPLLQQSILSSANCQRTLGWSHDSARVNLSKLFGCHFIWDGKVTCLGLLLIEDASHWKSAFQKLGMTVKQFTNVCSRVKSLLPEQLSPASVDKYSAQVRMPYHDGYVAITPVVSHALQSELQQAAINKYGKFTSIEFTRPASVSELVASLGGNVQVLNYPPRINQKPHGISDSQLSKLLSDKPVFNHDALSRFNFIKVIETLVSNRMPLALKQRRQQKVASIKQIRTTLIEWLAPMLEWRLEISEEKISASELEVINGSLEYQFLTFEKEQLYELLKPLLGLINTELSNSNATRQYAFHQHLMPYLRNGLSWLLSQIASNQTHPQKTDDSQNSQRYLYLKGIRVFDAQALSNPYCSGIPSLTAVWGMMHNYQRRLNEGLNAKLRMTSFSWFIRQYSAVGGKKLPEFRMQGLRENQFRRPGITDNRYCDFTFDLIIHINGYENDLKILDTEHEMLKSSFPANLAGGVMHPPELDTAGKWCELYQCETDLFTKIRTLPASGKWVMPTNHLIESVGDLFFLLDKNPSLCPTMFGYLPLTKPIKRVGSLEPLHCYAEPAIGVVECISAIQVRLQGQANYFKKAFWMLEAKEQSMLMKRI